MDLSSCNIHVATFQLLKNLRHLHSVDLDFVYVCSISYTVIERSQNFYAAVLWAEMSRSAAHFHALRDIPINYCTGVNGHDTPENQRSTLSPFVAPPPLLLFTSLTDLEQQTAAKWPTFWHFKHFLSFAKHCSGFVWGRPHLPHFFWLCFWDESFFLPFTFSPTRTHWRLFALDFVHILRRKRILICNLRLDHFLLTSYLDGGFQR